MQKILDIIKMSNAIDFELKKKEKRQKQIKLSRSTEKEEIQ